MTYQVLVFTVDDNRKGAWDWVEIPNTPGYALTYDWPGVREYSRDVGLSVRELDPHGLVTREYHPSVADDVPAT